MNIKVLNMNKTKDTYSISILLGLLGIISFIMVTSSPNIDSFLLELTIGLVIGGLMSYGYEIVKVLYEKKIAKKIKRHIIIYGIPIMLFVSVINYFYSSLLASAVGAVMSFLLVSSIYKKY